MKKTTAIIISAILLLLTGGFFYWNLRKYQEEQKNIPPAEGRSNFIGLAFLGAGATKGGSMLIGSFLLLVIVLVGIIVLFVIYGTAKVGKSVASDPDKAIDRTVKASEAYRNVRGR